MCKTHVAKMAEKAQGKHELSLPASLLISDDGGEQIGGTKDKLRAYGRVHIFEHGGQ